MIARHQAPCLLSISAQTSTSTKLLVTTMQLFDSQYQFFSASSSSPLIPLPIAHSTPPLSEVISPSPPLSNLVAARSFRERTPTTPPSARANLTPPATDIPSSVVIAEANPCSKSPLGQGYQFLPLDVLPSDFVRGRTPTTPPSSKVILASPSANIPLSTTSKVKPRSISLPPITLPTPPSSKVTPTSPATDIASPTAVKVNLCSPKRSYEYVLPSDNLSSDDAEVPHKKFKPLLTSVRNNYCGGFYNIIHSITGFGEERPGGR